MPLCFWPLGLRVSHFNEDKVGVPVDPTQKTLTTFLISGDASTKIVDDQSSFGSDLSDLHFRNDRETVFSVDIHETCHYEFGDPFKSNPLQDVDDNNCISSENAWEMEQIHELSSNKTEAMVFVKSLCTDCLTESRNLQMFIRNTFLAFLLFYLCNAFFVLSGYFLNSLVLLCIYSFP